MHSSRPAARLGNAVVGVLIAAFLLVTALALFMPFAVEMPTGQLDPSWRFALNQAVAQGLRFGSEVLFTGGPLASIYTTQYHPATDRMMLVGSLYLALTFWASVLVLFGPAKKWWLLTFALVLTMVVRDSLLMAAALVPGLVVYRLAKGEIPWSGRRWVPVCLFLLFAPLGLLPLVKGSFLLFCVATVALSTLLFVLRRQYPHAIACVAAPVVAMLFGWLASGQALSALPEFLGLMAPIVSGYTEAMALNGARAHVLGYLFASAVILTALAWRAEVALLERAFLFLLVAAFLFVTFKAGFVRHDGHALIAGTSILYCAFLLPAVLGDYRRSLLVAFVALLPWCQTAQAFGIVSPQGLKGKFTATFQAARDGALRRYHHRDWPLSDFEGALAAIRKESAITPLSGSADIYSFRQAYAIVSGARWAPRPVFQSYSAYTPELQEINKRHLQGPSAPDTILFKIEPIDYKLPSFDDGASWPLLLAYYRPLRVENDYVILGKRPIARGKGEVHELRTETHTLGERFELPPSRQPIFARVDLRPNLLGHAMGIVYKPSQLQVELLLHDGTQRTFRFVSGIAKAGFLLSPLVMNTAEFTMLYGKGGLLDSRKVKSMSISVLGTRNLQWNRQFAITFGELESGDMQDLASLSFFDPEETDVADAELAPEACNGSIDIVNGVFPAPSSVQSSTLLSVSGWLAESVTTGQLADSVYVVLTDSDGKWTFVNSRISPRPDLPPHFGAPKLVDAGYKSFVDVSNLSGDYKLTLGKRVGRKLLVCPQYNIPVSIRR